MKRGEKPKAWTSEEDAYLAANAGRIAYSALGRTLGRTGDAVGQRIRAMGLNVVTAEPIPSANRSVADIVTAQIAEYQRKSAHHRAKREGIEITLPDDGPFGILCFGDPHIDDPGTDAGQLFYHMDLVRETDGCYGANVGDMANNWVGRLKGLFAHQGTTDDEATELVAYLLDYIPWLWIIEGNHDRWSPILSLLCKQAGVTRVAHGGKFHVKAGNQTLVVDMRHSHKGNSQYNPSFGQAKQSYRGNDAHAIIGGHIHQGAYTQLRNGVTGRVNHCIRLGAYKKHDDYADANHFDQDDLGPACLLVCDTSLESDHLGFAKVFFDVDAGIDYLKFLRGKWRDMGEEQSA